jgi:hypothetical protein
MPTVSSGILSESNFLNLKGIPSEEVRPEVFDLLVDGEQPVAAFKTVRDQVIFTTKRIFVVNVQGLSGKKVSYFSYPYSKVQYFGVETAGLLDIDSELILAFSNGSKLTFDFKTSVDIHKLNTLISNYVL